MTNCCFCGHELTLKEGKSKICTQISDDDFAIVEIDSPLFCSECKEFFLSKEQLVEGFEQIGGNLSQSKTLYTGVYS